MVQGSGVMDWDSVIHSVAGTMFVNPERRYRVGELRQFIRGDTTNLRPVIFWVKQPILLLVIFWLRIENRYVNDVKNARITPILILPLLLRYFLTVPIAYGANPIPNLSILPNLFASYTAAT